VDSASIVTRASHFTRRRVARVAATAPGAIPCGPLRRPEPYVACRNSGPAQPA
jgi:hypothetical protein